jgi:sigma-E factor negative regulatory protein RseA
MTQEYENVSAMLDGEPVDAGFSKSLVDDPTLRAKWQSYHLTRDLMRNDMSTDIKFDISRQVSEALENELSMVAPKPTWRDLPVVSAVIPIMQQSGQLAMVACVTALVIFGFQTYNQPEETVPFNTAPPAIGPQGGMAPVSLQRSNVSEQDRMSQLLEQQRQITALIQDHERQQRLKNVESQQPEALSEIPEDAENPDKPLQPL